MAAAARRACRLFCPSSFPVGRGYSERVAGSLAGTVCFIRQSRSLSPCRSGRRHVVYSRASVRRLVFAVVLGRPYDIFPIILVAVDVLIYN
jgi:hypothetical protein